MKKIISFLAFFVSTLNCYSQPNLVNNGSFESYSTCPTAFSQIEYATGWKRSYYGNTNTSNWHVEYLNSCNGGNWVGMPVNGWGTQTAFDGNGYIAQAPACPLAQADYRENIYTQLSSPLVVGNTYRVSYRVSLGDECRYTANNICARFSTDTIFPIDNQAICISGVITDKINWTLVTDTFTADSAYVYLALGNFFDDANTIYAQTYPGSPNNNGTYYIDSVQVYQLGKNGIEETSGDFFISLSPNPARESFTINGLLSGTKGTIEMYGIDGKLVTSWNINVSAGNSATVALPAECPKGYYLIRFVGESTSRTEKLVVE